MSNRRPPTARRRGFSLVEVLIAVAVLAVGLFALISGAADFAGNAATLKQRALARWVAENRLAELSLQEKWPNTGEDDGRAEMGGVEWEWRTQIEKTPNKDIRRVVVTVGRDKGGTLARLEGFLGNHALRSGQ